MVKKIIDVSQEEMQEFHTLGHVDATVKGLNVRILKNRRGECIVQKSDVPGITFGEVVTLREVEPNE